MRAFAGEERPKKGQTHRHEIWAKAALQRILKIGGRRKWDSNNAINDKEGVRYNNPARGADRNPEVSNAPTVKSRFKMSLKMPI